MDITELQKAAEQALKVLRELANQDTYNARQDFYAAGGHEAIARLAAVLEPCGECHLVPGERCDICGKYQN
jgi:hypothetical protein